MPKRYERLVKKFKRNRRISNPYAFAHYVEKQQHAKRIRRNKRGH